MTRPKRSLGQNFLIDPNLQRKIVDALGAGPDDEVLEVGPGRGALTRHLAGAVRRLVAVELDDRLADELRREVGREPGVEIVQGDVLEMRLDELIEDPARAKVLGNLPYNITSPLLFWLLERRPRPARIVVMVQREVADRIVAAPGSKTYGALSIGVRAPAEVERLFHVSRQAFRPVPGVDSTVIEIVPRRPPPLEPAEEADLRTLVRAAFSWRRKQLQKTLRSAESFGLDRRTLSEVERETGIELTRRPESLSPEDFIRVARAIRARGYPVR